MADGLQGRLRAGSWPLLSADPDRRSFAYNLALQACPRTDSRNVQEQLTATFQRYGLPLRINTDNGAPFGVARRARGALTPLMAWLIRLGIGISHSHPRHPQTNGKNERFHRLVKAEVLARRGFRSMDDAQQAFDRWRHVYNHERPHEGIDMQVPIERYQPSPRSFPTVLPPVEDAYSPNDLILVLDTYGRIEAFGYGFTVSVNLAGEPIAARPHPTRDGIFDLYYCHHRLMRLSMPDRYAAVWAFTMSPHMRYPCVRSKQVQQQGEAWSSAFRRRWARPLDGTLGLTRRRTAWFGWERAMMLDHTELFVSISPKEA